MELFKFINGDKKAIIESSDNSYKITFFIKDRVVNRQTLFDIIKAEDLAECYVMSESNNGPTLLIENA
jgi:hypothetical protein